MKIKGFKRIISLLCASAVCFSASPIETVFAESAEIGSDISVEEKNSASPPLSSGALSGDFNNDGEVNEADASEISGYILDGGALEGHENCDVDANGFLDQTDADMISSYASGEIGYFPIGDYYDENESYITRGEWIHRLVQGFDMSVEDKSTIINYYSDLSDHQYGEEIEIAANFGVFDVLDDNFNPDEYVTRDFAAHTMSFCLGYPSDSECLYSDVDDVYYSGDAQVALNQGWFVTVNDQFRPSMYARFDEYSAAFKDMEDAVLSTEIDENYASSIEVDSSVTEITDASDITYDGTTAVITGSSETIEEGSDFAFTLDELYIVRKAESVSIDEENGIMTIETGNPEEEAVQSVDAEGFAYIDYDNIEVLDEDLNVDVVDDTASAQSKNIPMPSEPTVKNAAGTIKLKKTLDLNGKIKLGSGTVNLSGKIKNMRVPYQIDMSMLSVKKFYIGFEADAELKATLAAKLDKTYTNSKPILKVPIVGIGVVGANVVVSAKVSLSGEITLTYSCELGAGVQYTKGSGWRVTKNFKSKGFTIEANVKEKIGISVGVEVNLGKKKLGEVYAAAGESGSVSIINRSTGFTCTDLKAHLYAEAGANFDLGFGIKFSKTFEIINEDNSPLKIHIHWDNGKRVENCTYGKTSDKPSKSVDGGGSLSGAKAGGYKKSGGYSSGYVRTSHSVSTIPKYYTSTLNFKELEPPVYISEDTTLSEDWTVHTDLYITNGANLDLNGHKLTAEGNLYVGGEDGSYGTLNINKGSAVINGKLVEHRYGCVLMKNKNDYILVKGSFYPNQYRDDVMSAGTLELQGDIIASSDSYNSYIVSTDMHTVILSGDKDQTIDLCGDNTSFNMLEIKNADKRKFIVDKYFIASNVMSVEGDNLTFVCNESGNEKTEIRLGKISCKNINFNGKLTLRSIDFTGDTLNFTDDVKVYSTDTFVNLNGATMNVKGDFDGQGEITLNGGTINVDGNFSCYEWSNGRFVMSNKKDRLNIKGDFTLTGAGGAPWYDITDGITNIGGDVYIKNDTDFGGYNKTILSGTKDLTVYMEDSSACFNDLEIQNLDKRKVYVDGCFKTSGTTDCLDQPLNIVSRDGSLSLGELKASELNVSGDVSFYGSTTLNCKKADLDKNVTISSGTLDLNGVETNIKGNLVQNYYNSKLNLKGAVLNVKNYTMEDGNLYVNKGTMNISEDAAFGSYVEMLNAGDKIVIGGDLDLKLDSETKLTAGCIECAGNITSTKYPINSNDAFKMILTGKSDQTLNLNSYPESSADHHFATLDVRNSDSRKIILKDLLDAGELVCDGKNVNLTSSGGKLVNAKLRCDVNVSGDLITTGNYHVIDLNGCNFTVDGNLYQRSGTILPNTGTLSVKDYKIINDEDSAVYSPSSGILKMVNSGDRVIVNGSFITYTNRSHEDFLTAGVLEIKGDFYQYGAGSKFAFPASGTHLTILSGSEKQNVTFESYPDSHFNSLKMKQDKKQYTFNEDPCWNDICQDTTSPITTASSTITTTSATSTSSATSANKTSKTTTASSTAQTPPTTTVSTAPPSDEKKMGDINYDGKIDASDASIVLIEYANLSTGRGGTFTDEQKAVADVNFDNKIDASDSSVILAFYAYLSTGGEITDLKIWFKTNNTQ